MANQMIEMVMKTEKMRKLYFELTELKFFIVQSNELK